MKVSILGATGLVGRELASILEDRDLPIEEIRFFASSYSAGKHVLWKEKTYQIELLNKELFSPKEGEFVFICADEGVSQEFSPLARDGGATVIDHSSLYRMDPDVPLIVPEVNGSELDRGSNLIANPNCSTAQLVMVLAPLHEHFGLKRVVLSTYQSVSGAGQEGIEELSSQVVKLLNQQPLDDSVAFSRQIAFNCLPQIGEFDEEGSSVEEVKIHQECRKILSEENLPISVTSVRVPTFGSHAQSLSVETISPITISDCMRVLDDMRGVVVREDPAEFPDPISTIGQDDVFVGRIRIDSSVPSGINLWSVTDNLRKGAALNSVQIAELLI